MTIEYVDDSIDDRYHFSSVLRPYLIELPFGIYEQVINKAFKKSLEENDEKTPIETMLPSQLRLMPVIR